jgi:tetratricopeptide (TPR) repeat protein
MTNAQETKDPVVLKETGNEFYKKGQNSDAIEAYSKAIELCEELKDEKTLAVCLKNRAAVYLKEENYDATIEDCTRFVCQQTNP